jgi:methionyl-tRNA formyltransferase
VLGGISHIYEPVMRVVIDAMLVRCGCTDSQQCAGFDYSDIGTPDLIVAAGWRHLIPKSVLDIAPTVGFHHAKLPEYPGRAPVPWTLLRGDKMAWTTLLYLDYGPDTGDIIDQVPLRVEATDTAASLYAKLGWASALQLGWLPEILDGTAPRQPQDMSKRGPLTTADGWQRLGQSL